MPKRATGPTNDDETPVDASVDDDELADVEDQPLTLNDLRALGLLSNDADEGLLPDEVEHVDDDDAATTEEDDAAEDDDADADVDTDAEEAEGVDENADAE